MSLSIKKVIDTAQQGLESISDSARLDAECMLSFVLNKETVYLRTWPEKILDDSIHEQFLKLLKRREQGEPIAYIVGSKEFWSFNLNVSKDTLIPRPETEMLVEQVIKIAHQQKLNSILELGTGTGAIAIAISSEIQKLEQQPKIVATDISLQALDVAKQNAARYKQGIEFVESDWFNSIELQKFDLIVSNPPYIQQGDVHLTQGDVRFEPMSALVSGDDGLDDIRAIIEQAKNRLNPGGYLIFEHGYDQGSAVRALFEANAYTHIQTHTDLAKNDRMTFAVNN